MRTAFALGALAALLAAACGGGGSSSGSGGSNSGGGTGTTPGSGNANSSATVITTSSGTTSGVDITVPAVSSAVLNAEVLGVADANSTGGTASNTGASIARGSQMRVLLFGTGLSGSLDVKVAGPTDITISSVQSISSKSGKPGVSFLVTVANNAAVGARTVILRDSAGNVTTFTGGLEIK